MEEMIAFCGNICTDCPAYLATKNNDDNERKKVAEIWKKKYNPKITYKDINCDGCISGTGRLFGYCKTCDIRHCGIEKLVYNCAYCNDYVCDKLANFYNLEPEGKKILDKIRAQNKKRGKNK